MTLKALYQLLKGTLKCPVAYDHFTEPQTPPFAAYIDTGTDTYSADGITGYTKQKTVQVELYTDNKREDLESALEALFDNNRLHWDDEGVIYIKEEQVYQKIYTLKL